MSLQIEGVVGGIIPGANVEDRSSVAPACPHDMAVVGLGSKLGAPPVRGGDVLACGFGMTVAAWIVAYVSRMPVVNAPGQVTVLAMLGMVLLGGFLTGRHSRKGVWGAVMAGAVSGVLDLLVLGSVASDMAKEHEIAPMAAMWIGGSILLNAAVAGVGGVLGRTVACRKHEIRWTAVFAVVLAVATLPLITAGGLVTAFHAGLAVPDWPQSYGYNMFLFPLSKMQSAVAGGGTFYEHAHRLMGSLVGLTALTVAIYVTMVERRGWVKVLAWTIGVGVLIQAILGGTRVTERSVTLAVAHGIFAQLVFATMAALAVVSSGAFVKLPQLDEKRAKGVGVDRLMTAALVLAMVVQLMLGALVRHRDWLVILHILMATAVTGMALVCGFRAWGIYGDIKPVKRTGLIAMGLVLVQLTLGVLALATRSGPEGAPTVGGAFLTTAHQANGALLMATVVALAVWVWGLVPEEAGEVDGKLAGVARAGA